MDVKNRIARRFVRHEALPNELLIQLRASAIRQHWTPYRERQARGCLSCGVAPLDAPPEFSALADRNARRSRR